MNPEQLKQYLEFYRDLGVKELYRVSTSAGASRGSKRQLRSPEPDIPIELAAVDPVGDTIESIRLDIGDCKRCRLCEQRNKIVFGVGDENASSSSSAKDRAPMRMRRESRLSDAPASY